MSTTNVETILAEVNRQPESAGELPAEVQLAIGMLLNPGLFILNDFRILNLASSIWRTD